MHLADLYKRRRGGTVSREGGVDGGHGGADVGAPGLLRRGVVRGHEGDVKLGVGIISDGEAVR